jgi:hypothetical protein
MPTTTIYYSCPGGTYGSREATYPQGGTPPTPPAGCTALTKAQYDAGVAAITSAQAAAEAQTRITEDRDNRLSQNAPTRLVASATAPAPVKRVASYVCDGTSDDVQINQAITEAIADNALSVTLSTGTFHLGDSINIPVVQGLSIRGCGWDTRLKVAPASNRYAVRFSGAGDTRVAITDMTIDGSMLDQTTGGGCILAPGAVECLFSNLHLTGFFEYGISLRGMTGGAFGHNNRLVGILADGSMASPGAGTAFHSTSSDENWISNTGVNFCGGVQGQASAYLDQSGTNFVQNLNVVNGRCGIPAIRLKDCTNTKIIGANLDGVGGTGIHVTGSGHVIQGCTAFGIGIDTGTGTYTAGSSTGVFLEFGAVQNLVTNNVLATHTVDGAAHSLVRCPGDGDATLNLVMGNQLIQKGTAAQGLLDLHGVGNIARSNVGPAGLLPDVVTA